MLKTILQQCKRVAVLSALFSLSGTASAVTVLEYSDHQPLDGMRMQFLDTVFFPAVEAESNGRIKINRHWDGELAVAYDALPAVTSGKVDISTVVPEYKADKMPLHQIFKSFPVGPAAGEQVQLFRDIYQQVPQFNQELADNNIHPIFLATGYPAGFFSHDPIKNIDDLAGHKWRSASFWHLDFLTSAGAEPVRMHWSPEIFTALSDGRIDGIFVNIDSAYNLDLHKSAPYALVSPNLWLGHLYIVAINQDVWNKLDKQDQQAFERAAEYAYGKLGQVMTDSYNNMLAKLKSEGTDIRTLSKQEVINWMQKTQYQQHQAKWVETLGSKSEDGKKAIAEVQKMLTNASGF